MEYAIGIMIAAALAFLLACTVWVGLAVIRNIGTASVVRRFETCIHHSNLRVWVRSDLKGKHRDHCLCFDCKKFRPGLKGNCHTAQMLYEVCVEHDLVTPVWECRKFEQDPYAYERNWNQ